MAERAFPLDNTLYYANDLRLFHAGRTGGIVNYTGDDFPLVRVTGLNVTIGPGVAFLKTGEDEAGGIVYKNDEDITVRMDPPTASTRYDYIALQYDSFNNSVTLKSVRGGASMPLPVRSSGIWELILYVVQVQANVSALNGADITDTRLEENLCGLTVDTLLKIPTEGLYQQFNAFMENLKDKLGGTVAGNLQNQIDDLQDRLDAFLNGSGTSDSIQESIRKLQTAVNTHGSEIDGLDADLQSLQSIINQRAVINSVGSGLTLSGGVLSTITPPVKIGTSAPSATSLAEGQIYLQV